MSERLPRLRGTILSLTAWSLGTISITSAGISAGIDMALRVVSRHHGNAVGRATARYMEYPFPEDNRRRV